MGVGVVIWHIYVYTNNHKQHREKAKNTTGRGVTHHKFLSFFSIMQQLYHQNQPVGDYIAARQPVKTTKAPKIRELRH